MAAASFSASYCCASASFWRRYNSASAFCISAYLSASAFLRISASSFFSATSASFVWSSISFSRRAISASCSLISTVFREVCFWISYAASASALFVSSPIFNSALRISKSLFRCAMASSAATFASLALLAASADATSTSRSAFAFATRAVLRIVSRLSIPRSSISPSLSLTFWTLKERIRIPSSFISCSAFCLTSWLNFALSWQMLFKSMVPMISRRFPCKDSVIIDRTSSAFRFRKFRMATGDTWLLETSIATWAMASTLILIKSLVGI